MIIPKKINVIVKCVLVVSIFLLTFQGFNNKWYQQQDKNKIQDDRFTYKVKEEITLEKLHQKIWNQIKSLQEEGNCEEKKIMHCENVGNYAGLGSMMMSYGACMQIAFALGRMFFIHQDQYKHFGGLSSFFKNESSRCGYIKETYRSSDNICNMHNRYCYQENAYEINNSYKVLEFNSIAKFPGPRRMPGTIPFDIEKQLISLKVEDPWLWFTSQFLGYLVLRLTPEMVKLMNLFKKGMNFNYPLISIHIRHGIQKVTNEASFVKEEVYMSVADYYFENYLPNIEKQRVYIASDNKDILKVLKEIRPNYEFLQLPREYAAVGLNKYNDTNDLPKYLRPNFPKEVLGSIIFDIHFLLNGNYTICTLSSNVCRLLWSLKLARPPYRIGNSLYSVDTQEKLNYFIWYGYMAPFPGHWTPIRYSYVNVTFPDGLKMMHYFPGLLLRVNGRKKIIKVKNKIYYVVYANTVYGYADTREGYVLTEDIVEWPGRPSYHFYN